MAAQYLTSWKPSCIVVAHNALITLIAAGAGDPSITVHDSSDVLLAEIPLASTPGTVNQTTGEIVIATNGREESAPAGGVPSYATIRDGDGNALRSLPCKLGASSDPGWCVMESMTIAPGDPVSIIDAIIL